MCNYIHVALMLVCCSLFVHICAMFENTADLSTIQTRKAKTRQHMNIQTTTAKSIVVDDLLNRLKTKNKTNQSVHGSILRLPLVQVSTGRRQNLATVGVFFLCHCLRLFVCLFVVAVVVDVVVLLGFLLVMLVMLLVCRERC